MRETSLIIQFDYAEINNISLCDSDAKTTDHLNF